MIEYTEGSKVVLIKSNASDEDVCRAAWVSNFGDEAVTKLAEEGRQAGLINFLYRERHMSPFEHGSLTFFIDTPIFVAREFMRHRTFSYNETSGRYKELEPRFYVAPHGRPKQQTGKVGSYRFESGTYVQNFYVSNTSKQAYENSWGAYKNMLNAGVAREVARNVLPVGTMTQFYVTGNPRNFMQFFQLRNDDNALYEIRAVAAEMESIFAEQMPLTYSAYKKYDWRDEKKELESLRAQLAAVESQAAAYETYHDNIGVSSRPMRFFKRKKVIL